MSVFTELRRRNIFRAATIYAAGAWLLVQIATQVLPYFGIDASVLRWIVLGLVAGFPLAMLFSWFYEWTPEGIRRESAIAPEASISRETGRKLDLWIIGVLSLIVVVLLVDAFAPHVEPDVAVEKSIAVLPLSNGSEDAHEQYFSDGLSEDLIIALSQLNGLKVISRNSSFRFRDSKTDSSSIGKDLGAAYLLDGSVRRADGRVSIVLELIKAGDGSTVWSQRYERPYGDLFSLQDEITGEVANALQAELAMDAGAVTQSDRPPSGNLPAYNAYLQAKFYYERRSEADYRRAIELYAEATRLDPQYALAHAGLSYALSELAGYYLSGNEALQAYAQARIASATAMRLQPDLALAHGARAWLMVNADRDFVGAEAEFRRALQLAPNDSDAKADLGSVLATLGQVSQAIKMTQESIASDPLHSESHTALASYLSSLGRLDEARKAILKSIELQPSAGWERVQLAIIEIQREDAAAALAAARQVHDEGGWVEIGNAFAQQVSGSQVQADAALKTLVDTQSDISAFQIAEVFALRADPDRMFEWLDHAIEIRDPGIARLWFDPFILRYKHDPRFIAFCDKVGLPSIGDGLSVPAATTP
ncbi:MAG: tetratricopeptide repeat protein [Thermomonas sp.]